MIVPALPVLPALSATGSVRPRGFARAVGVAVVLSFAGGFGAPAASSAEGDQELARAAKEILKDHCYQCHGRSGGSGNPNFNVLSRESMLHQKPSDQRADPYLKPGDAVGSLMYQRVRGIDGAELMPPEYVDDDARLSEDEIALLETWIAAGAPAAVTPRPFVSETLTLTAILNDLAGLRADEVDYVRYFSLAHLHNNPKYTDAEVRLYRAGFVKLINSLSRRGDLYDPPMIDAPADAPRSGTLFRVDLRKVGWDAQDWRRILGEYPYGVRWTDSALSLLQSKIDRLSGRAFMGIPYVRIDWFASVASRPPLYHHLLDLPETTAALHQELNVRRQEDFDKGNMLRSAFGDSGVSRHNRVVDRHPSGTGYYYQTAEFNGTFGKRVATRFPLGPPEMTKNSPTMADFAFEHAGGEAIFQLPNGLQAYFIENAAGERIDEAPIELVFDPRAASGTPVVVNGISCMSCHKLGLISYRDTVRRGFQLPVADAVRGKVEALYAPQKTIDDRVAADRRAFINAATRLCGPYLVDSEVGPDADEIDLNAYPEPISSLVALYDDPMLQESAAFELGFAAASEFDPRVHPELLQDGLAPFLDPEGRIPRSLWTQGSENLFHESLRELNRGTGVKIPPIAD
ncbi:c-type cytochrome domain-containing protein [Alienimonas chondri]|uniref:Cytochrome c domain-containing protein n=1 Tax=Alienimonas chondri TaxID=2681879 RepID=A0ABX1VFJ4_9PLAN|nr:c-type cytochrome domain-containing protein [Alienimonas chondri]NNJ26864.1 hypothetical protein [Alienimonas chondri]